MNEKNKNEIEDKQMRQLFSGTEMRASDNLKFRIMQQIETEKSLARKKSKNNYPVLKSMLSVYGIMYSVLAILVLGVYLMYGKEVLESASTFLYIILVVSVFSIFWTISLYDENRRKKKRNKE